MAQKIEISFMDQLVDPATNTVRFDTLRQTHEFLLRKGFMLFHNGRYDVGRQLYYTQGDLLLRIKTHGDVKGPRKDQAHLSVALVPTGILSDYKEEWAKFDSQGTARGKPSVPPSDPLFDLWAKATHFNFARPHLLDAEHLVDVFGPSPTRH